MASIPRLSNSQKAGGCDAPCGKRQPMPIIAIGSGAVAWTDISCGGTSGICCPVDIKASSSLRDLSHAADEPGGVLRLMAENQTRTLLSIVVTPSSQGTPCSARSGGGKTGG